MAQNGSPALGCDTLIRGVEARPVARATREETFRAFYDRYLSPVYKYCYRRLPTVEDAEDATSLIFTKAYVHLPDQADERVLRSWLFSIAHNVVVDLYRSRRHSVGLDQAERVADAATSPESQALVADELRSLLARLPDEQARILELRLAGLTGPEIARVLGKNPGAVRVAQFRAYETLRSLLIEAPQGTETSDEIG